MGDIEDQDLDLDQDDQVDNIPPALAPANINLPPLGGGVGGGGAGEGAVGGGGGGGGPLGGGVPAGGGANIGTAIYSIDANGVLAVNNGVAYATIAGGATGYIAEAHKLYTGVNIHLYLAALLSRGEELWKLVAFLAIRGAIAAAALNHAPELGPLVNNGNLRINLAETIGDPELRNLMNFARITSIDWGGQPNANVANFLPNRLSPVVAGQMRNADMVQWATMVARMAYTVIATNGVGLITASHHLRGQAERAAHRTVSLYDLSSVLRTIGIMERDAVGTIFHDSLHYLSYEDVAILANNAPAGFIAKVASTVLKRMPAFPGGVIFVQRAITARRLVFGMAQYDQVRTDMIGQPADLALDVLYAAILASPLDYNGQFRPQQYAANRASIDAVADYAITLFALYDEIAPYLVGVGQNNNNPNAGIVVSNAAGAGPTGGPGIRKMIQENLARYQNTRVQARLVIAAAAANVGIQQGFWNDSAQ